MVAVPAATPVTTPVVASMVAIDVALLLHVPPVEVSAKVVVADVQTVAVPVIDAGVAGMVFTVTPKVATDVPQLVVTE